jgi:peptidoglycan/LPS O-acetylase OafA/YrhL
MLHWAVFIGLDLLVIGVPRLGAPWVYRLLVLAALPMLGGLSYLSWRFYEEPARAGFRRLARRLQDKTAIAVSAAESDAPG